MPAPLTFAGTALSISEEDGIVSDPDPVIFSVNGQGFLNVNIAGLSAKPPSRPPSR